MARYRAISSVAVFFLLAAFILLLLVAISLPIIKPIYILALQTTVQVQATTVTTQLRFGVWGVCAAKSVVPLFFLYVQSFIAIIAPLGTSRRFWPTALAHS